MKKVVVATLLIVFSGATYANHFDCLAKAMYREALDQPLEGRIMVGVVVKNLSKKNKYCSVTENKHLFPWREFSLPKKKIDPIKQDWIDFQKGKVKIKSGLLSATHFHHKRIKPKWAKKLKYLGSIGDHRFYKEV